LSPDRPTAGWPARNRPIRRRRSRSRTAGSPWRATLPPLRFSSSAPLADGALAIRIENVGTVRCEATLDESPIVDESMEPDVWLDAGGAGELLVEVDATSCPTPGPVESIGLIVNGAPVAVVVEPFEACTITLTALYPL
jgi:hypothetical protein